MNIHRDNHTVILFTSHSCESQMSLINVYMNIHRDNPTRCINNLLVT